MRLPVQPRVPRLWLEAADVPAPGRVTPRPLTRRASCGNGDPHEPIISSVRRRGLDDLKRFADEFCLASRTADLCPSEGVETSGLTRRGSDVASSQDRRGVDEPDGRCRKRRQATPFAMATGVGPPAYRALGTAPSGWVAARLDSERANPFRTPLHAPTPPGTSATSTSAGCPPVRFLVAAQTRSRDSQGRARRLGAASATTSLPARGRPRSRKRDQRRGTRSRPNE